MIDSVLLDMPMALVVLSEPFSLPTRTRT